MPEPIDDIPQDGQPLGEPKEPSGDPSPQKPQEKDEPAQEGDSTPDDNVPFHKHPRWVEMQSELKELREFKTNLETSPPNPAGDEKIPDPFVRMFGDNPEAWKEWKALNQSQKEEWKQELMAELEKEETNERQAVVQAEGHIKNSVATLKAKGEDFQENELMKFMLDFEKEYSPIVDAQGNYDFTKGLALMRKFQGGKPNSDIKKRVADTSTNKGKASTTEDKPYATSIEMGRKGWSTV